MKKFETEGHQQSEAAGHRQGLKEWHRLHGSGDEARPRTARRRSGETEGQAASRRGSNQERLCSAIRKRPFCFKPAEVQSRTKFLNGVIWGLSDRWGSEEAERSHRNKASKLSGAQEWSDKVEQSHEQERSDKVQRSHRSEATKFSGAWMPEQRRAGQLVCIIILIPKTIGNRKRDCAWGCAWGINTTWENLQIEKHKSVRWAERTPSWFVLFDLQIFSGGVYSPSATSRTISFSISNSFWY